MKQVLVVTALVVLAAATPLAANAQSQNAPQADSRSFWDRVMGRSRTASEMVARAGMASVFAGQTKTVQDDRGWTVVTVEILRDGKARFTPYNANKAGAAVDVAAGADGAYTVEMGLSSNGLPLIDGVVVKGKGNASSQCAPVRLRAAAANMADAQGRAVLGWLVTATVQVARGGGESPCAELMPHEFTSK